MLSIRSTLSRRSLLAGAAGGAVMARTASAQDTPIANSDGSYSYEIQKTAEEWQAALSEEQFAILREGKTEKPFASPYAKEDAAGTYHCQACELPIYRSEHYSPQKIGFVFFDHSIPNAVLTGIDITDYNGMLPEPEELVEIHCRRCGGHLGHLVVLDGASPLHCINGTALKLETQQT